MALNHLTKLFLAGCLGLPIISSAQPKSIENNKSLSQGIKENPIMAYVIPTFEDLRIQELHSEPKSGSIRISYNNEQKTRVSGVNAQKAPPSIEKSKISAALAEAIDKALAKNQAPARNKRSFTTDKGVAVNCIGVILKDKKMSNSICYSVFDNYYVQANMVWGLNNENKEQAYARSDGFVKAVIDRMSEYPDI